MPKSINQDVYVGSVTYHIQTEYYKGAGKIVTNIFKDGMSVKRLEKPVSGLSDDEIDKEIEKFHYFVLDKLRQGVVRKRKEVSASPQEGEERSQGGFSISEEVYRRVLAEISPFFGVASSAVLEEALKRSSDPENFVEELLSELPSDQTSSLEEKLLSIFEEGKFVLGEELKEEILRILSDYFGIMSAIVLDESIEEWEASGGTPEELASIIAAHADDPDEEEEIRRRVQEVLSQT